MIEDTLQIHSFTAIDFETAHHGRNTICQVGLVRVERGIITDKISTLVRPPDNKYFYRNIDIHGITPQMTRNAPTFNVVWPRLKPYIQNQVIVAHNASFDVGCLTKTLEFYRLNVPEFSSFCTFKIYGSNLQALCYSYGIDLNHHDALSDALACARLFLIHLRNQK